MLTDLEFRVWIQYLLSADDFGVMRRSAVTLQAANDHLSNRPKKQVDRCLDSCVTSGLLLAFEHQGRTYVCQGTWQEFQKVEYPRPTMEPKPPDDVLARCTARTRELFGKHPGGSLKRVPKVSRKIPENSDADSQTVAEDLPEIPDYARGRVRETAKANGERLEASGSEGVPGEPTARSKRPIFAGQKLVVFEWMLDNCLKDLGEYANDFDLHEWFFQLDAAAVQANLVIPKRDHGEWLQAQLVAEAQRRGLPIRMATAAATAPANKRIAGLMAGGQAFLNRRQG